MAPDAGRVGEHEPKEHEFEQPNENQDQSRPSPGAHEPKSKDPGATKAGQTGRQHDPFVRVDWFNHERPHVSIDDLTPLQAGEVHYAAQNLLVPTGVETTSGASGNTGAVHSWSLVILMFAPVVTIVAYEVVARRAMDDPLFWT
jgi:hypothetical protein